MTQEELEAIYSAAQQVIDKYADESNTSYGRAQEANKSGAQAPEREGPSREDRSLNRLIQREIKRALATGRTERLNEALKIKQEQKNYAENNSPSSTVYQKPAQNEPVKINRSGPEPRTIITPPKGVEFEQTVDYVPNQPPCPLGLYNNNNNVWIKAGNVANELPAGFDSQNGVFIASNGNSYVWAKIEINDSTGEINSREISSGTTVPSNTNTSFYYTLGYYEYRVDGTPILTNYGCGSLDVTVCRNWFAAEAPFYGVSFFRSES